MNDNAVNKQQPVANKRPNILQNLSGTRTSLRALSTLYNTTVHVLVCVHYTHTLTSGT